MTQDTTIRYATENDLAAILGLITDLAIYEKAEHEVKVTLAQLTQDFKEGIFQTQVAVNEHSEVMGMTLYYITYSTWKGKMLYLEDFVISEKHRRKGIGRLLFDSVIAEAKKQNCKLMKWQVLDWNEPAIDFYKTYDATIETEWFNGKILF
jgi:GNAT superfamily N-acetyltransferase